MERVDALELLQSRNRYEHVLPSGFTYTYRLPRVRDCILAGDVPLPVLEHMASIAKASENGDSPEEPEGLSLEEARHIGRFQDEIVRRMVLAIDGQEIERPMSAEALEAMPQEDYDALAAWGMRALPPGEFPPTTAPDTGA